MKKKEINELQNDRNMYKRLYEEQLKKVTELTNHNMDLRTQLDFVTTRQGSEIHRMLEIIRWSINPKTAERPEPENFHVNKYMV